jgi:hypothetical protein
MKSFIAYFFLCVCIMSCDTMGNADNSNSSNKEAVSKPANRIIKKTYYPSGKIATAIAYNTDGLKDSLSTYYDTIGNADSAINFAKGKLDGIATTYYGDRTEIRLYENDSLLNLSIYDAENVLEYKMPLDTTLIKKARYRFTSGRDYFDKSKTDTLILVIEGVPMANRMISISGASMAHLNDTSYIIRSPKKQNADSVIIHIGIGYSAYDSDDSTNNSTIYQSIRFEKK